MGSLVTGTALRSAAILGFGRAEIGSTIQTIKFGGIPVFYPNRPCLTSSFFAPTTTHPPAFAQSA